MDLYRVENLPLRLHVFSHLCFAPLFLASDFSMLGKDKVEDTVMPRLQVGNSETSVSVKRVLRTLVQVTDDAIPALQKYWQRGNVADGVQIFGVFQFVIIWGILFQ